MIVYSPRAQIRTVGNHYTGTCTVIIGPDGSAADPRITILAVGPAKRKDFRTSARSSAHNIIRTNPKRANASTATVYICSSLLHYLTYRFFFSKRFIAT
jgi:hypothetical protein